jgi:hypothetical protein
MVPHPRDLGHFFQHVGWFFRLCPEPSLDRWGYWEKFDYWADGKLGERLTDEVPLARKAIYMVFGYAAMAAGLYLLVGALLHATRITW